MSLSQLCARIHRRRVRTFASGRRASPRGPDRFGRRKRRGDPAGQALVEFALALPLIITLLVGIIETGRYVAVHTAVASASREAARYGSVSGMSGTPQYIDCDGIRNTARDVAPILALSDGDIDISYDDGADPATVVVAACPPASPDDIDRGHRIVVTVSTTFQPVMPLFPAFDLTSTDRRTIFKEAPSP